MKKGFFPCAFLAFILVGCKVGPIYEVPDVAIPTEWHSEVSEGFNTQPPEDLIWWESLQDPILNNLMAYAAAQNLDLKIAAIRVLQARAESKGKKADLYPRIDGSATYNHVYYSKDGLVNGLIGNAVPVDSKHVKRNVDIFELGFDAEWEIDFFGLKAHEIAASRAQEEGVHDLLCGVWVTLSAEIAKNYIELRGLQRRLEIAKRTIKTQEEALQLTQQLLTRGVVDQSDYSKMQAEWNALNAELPPIELHITRAIHRLSMLLGYAPGDLFTCLEASCQLPDLPLELSIGIPSELLRRRPDIRKAERDLAAATERVGSAIAGLFPRFSLRGFLGDISTHAGSLFNPASATWLAGPQILVPIFNSRLLLQEVEYNKLATQEALYTYQKTVMEALEESENAIAAYGYEKERLRHLMAAYQHSQAASAFAKELYQKGINDNFALRIAEKSLLAAEDSLVRSQVELILYYIALYKALGGSWADCN